MSRRNKVKDNHNFENLAHNFATDETFYGRKKSNPNSYVENIKKSKKLFSPKAVVINNFFNRSRTLSNKQNINKSYQFHNRRKCSEQNSMRFREKVIKKIYQNDKKFLVQKRVFNNVFDKRLRKDSLKKFLVKLTKKKKKKANMKIESTLQNLNLFRSSKYPPKSKYKNLFWNYEQNFSEPIKRSHTSVKERITKNEKESLKFMNKSHFPKINQEIENSLKYIQKTTLDNPLEMSLVEVDRTKNLRKKRIETLENFKNMLPKSKYNNFRTLSKSLPKKTKKKNFESWGSKFKIRSKQSRIDSAFLNLSIQNNLTNNSLGNIPYKKFKGTIPSTSIYQKFDRNRKEA